MACAPSPRVRQDRAATALARGQRPFVPLRADIPRHGLQVRARRSRTGPRRPRALRTAPPPSGVASVRESVFARLRAFIAKSKLRPGDPLPSEHALAARFGVSRPSLREAVMALRQLGLLESAPRRGLTIGQLDTRRLGECLEVHAAISEYAPEQLVRARAVIELGIIPYVSEKMRADPILAKQLWRLTEDPEIVRDSGAYLKADLAFHRALLDASGIAPLAFFEQLLASFFERFSAKIAGPTRAQREAGVDLHRRILAAMGNGDIAGAQELVRESLRHYDV